MLLFRGCNIVFSYEGEKSHLQKIQMVVCDALICICKNFNITHILAEY